MRKALLLPGVNPFIADEVGWGKTIEAALWSAIPVQWLPVKSAHEIAATPLAQWVMNTIKRREGVDMCDTQIDFNPLKVRG